MTQNVLQINFLSWTSQVHKRQFVLNKRVWLSDRYLVSMMNTSQAVNNVKVIQMLATLKVTDAIINIIYINHYNPLLVLYKGPISRWSFLDITIEFICRKNAPKTFNSNFSSELRSISHHLESRSANPCTSCLIDEVTASRMLINYFPIMRLASIVSSRDQTS